MIALFYGGRLKAVAYSAEGYPDDWLKVPIDRAPEPHEEVLSSGVIVDKMEEYREFQSKRLRGRAPAATIADMEDAILLVEAQIYDATGTVGVLMQIELEGSSETAAQMSARIKADTPFAASSRSRRDARRQIRTAQNPQDIQRANRRKGK